MIGINLQKYSISQSINSCSSDSVHAVHFWQSIPKISLIRSEQLWESFMQFFGQLSEMNLKSFQFFKNSPVGMSSCVHQTGSITVDHSLNCSNLPQFFSTPYHTPPNYFKLWQQLGVRIFMPHRSDVYINIFL